MIDHKINKIGQVLVKKLNEKQFIVNTYRTYDALNVPLSDFPLLCVYRITDTYRPFTLLSNCYGVITYSLSYPQLNDLPGVLKYVADTINVALIENELELPPNRTGGYRAEYRLMKNDVIQSVYPFLRFTFGFTEGFGECEPPQFS